MSLEIQKKLIKSSHENRSEETLIYDGFDITVTDDQLSEFFRGSGGTIVSLTKYKDVYNIAGNVTYQTVEQAKTALSSLNGRLFNGKPIELNISDMRSRLTMGRAKLFFNKFDSSLNEEDVRGAFEEFGTVISFKLITDKNGHSKGYGFVEFEKEEAAQDAIIGLSGMLLNEQVLLVSRFVSKQEREETERELLSRTVFVKNLTESSSYLRPIFNRYGQVCHIGFLLDEDRDPIGCALVLFKTREEAAYAIEELNGSVHDDKKWIVEWALSKSELSAQRKAKFEQEKTSKFRHLQACNLYVKNLDNFITDEKLKELFSKFGRITSSKVMVNSKGLSKGHGFVAFCTPDDAARAVIEMNGKMIARKPLYVSFAEHKDERKARLEAHFTRVPAPGKAPVANSMNAVQLLKPGMRSPQFVVYQGSPSSPPVHLASNEVEHQLSFGCQPDVASKYTAPYLMREQGQRTGSRRGVPLQQLQQPQLDQLMNQHLAAVPHTPNAPVSASQQIAQPRRHPTITT